MGPSSNASPALAVCRRGRQVKKQVLVEGRGDLDRPAVVPDPEADRHRIGGRQIRSPRAVERERIPAGLRLNGRVHRHAVDGPGEGE